MIKGYGLDRRYGFADLIEIMKILRGEGGCPWDREQTHSSIRKNLIEETYEAVEAIDSGDKTLLQEELGDVLLQVAFHSEMEREAGNFDINDVIDGVCHKLIERHPHVFGDVKAETSEQVLSNWERIKKKEKSRDDTQSLEAVPRALPALMRSQKVLQRAAKAGADLPDVKTEIARAEETLKTLKAAGREDPAVKDRLGKLLFAAANLARLAGCDAEEALTASCDRFIRDFASARENHVPRKAD